MIIGLIGFAGSGKGAAADILVEKKRYTKLAFADTVKDATAAIFGWPRNLLEGDTDESRAFRELTDAFWTERFGYNFTPRLALQMMGTEAGRDVFHKDIWIHALEKKMAMYKDVVIADVRFPNEIEFIQSKGGFVVRVKRGPDPEWYNDAIIANSNPENADRYIERLEANHRMDEHHKIHYSEWAWIGSPTDYQLDNIGTFSMLEGDIEHMLRVFTGPKNPVTIAA
jgi:hypothetical protein